MKMVAASSLDHIRMMFAHGGRNLFRLVLTLWTPGDGLPTLRKLPTLLGVC